MIEFVYWLLSYVIPFLAVLTVIVFVHEMGHYLVARWNGVAIQAFSIGFGRELVGWNDKHGTRWKISAIPLGGYVRFVGDMNEASLPDPDAAEKVDPALAPHLFINKNVWQRISVVAAGPLANLLLTFVILYVLLMSYGRVYTPPEVAFVSSGSVAQEAGIEAGDQLLSVDGYAVRGFEDFQRMVATSPERAVTVAIERGGQRQDITLVPEEFEGRDRFGNRQRIGDVGAFPYILLPIVGEVHPGSAAAEAGIQPGDVFTGVNGKPVTYFEDFQRAVAERSGDSVRVDIDRGGRALSLDLTPRAFMVEGESVVGIGISAQEPTLPEPTHYRPGPIEAVGMTFEEIRFIVERTVAYLGRFFVGQGDFEQLGGPVKVAKVSGEVATFGVVALINLVALLSLNIGIFNLLPVPMLDGGHLLYYLVEAVRGRPLSMKVQEIGFRFGFALVLALMVFTLFNDTIFAYFGILR